MTVPIRLERHRAPARPWEWWTVVAAAGVVIAALVLQVASERSAADAVRRVACEVEIDRITDRYRVTLARSPADPCAVAREFWRNRRW